MDAKVAGWFRDKETRKMYAPGQAYSGTPSRVRELARLGYVEARPTGRPPAPEKEGERGDGALRD